MKRRLLACVLGGIAAFPVHALSLVDAYMAARQYDPEYRAAWQARQAAWRLESRWSSPAWMWSTSVARPKQPGSWI